MGLDQLVVIRILSSSHLSTGNTALHECVRKGPARIDCIEALLRYSTR